MPFSEKSLYFSKGSIVYILFFWFPWQDAWFESTEVDKRFAGKLKEKEKAEEEDAELTTEEIWRIKRRISDALLPEETV
jgi:hypothetical protein